MYHALVGVNVPKAFENPFLQPINKFKKLEEMHSRFDACLAELRTQSPTFVKDFEQASVTSKVDKGLAASIVISWSILFLAGSLKMTGIVLSEIAKVSCWTFPDNRVAWCPSLLAFQEITFWPAIKGVSDSAYEALACLLYISALHSLGKAFFEPMAVKEMRAIKKLLLESPDLFERRAAVLKTEVAAISEAKAEGRPEPSLKALIKKLEAIKIPSGFDMLYQAGSAVWHAVQRGADAACDKVAERLAKDFEF